VVVGDLDVELCGTFNNLLSRLSRQIVGELGAITSIVHQQDFNISGVTNEESLETIGTQKSCLFVATVTDLGHGTVALEPAANTGINTLGFSPAGLNTIPLIRVETDKVRLSLFDDFWFGNGLETDHLE